LQEITGLPPYRDMNLGWVWMLSWEKCLFRSGRVVIGPSLVHIAHCTLTGLHGFCNQAACVLMVELTGSSHLLYPALTCRFLVGYFSYEFVIFGGHLTSSKTLAGQFIPGISSDDQCTGDQAARWRNLAVLDRDIDLEVGRFGIARLAS